MLPAEIQLTRSRLRPWRTSDRTSLLRHADDRDVWRNLRDRFPHPYTERDADEWLSHAAVEPPPQGIYAIEVDGEDTGLPYVPFAAPEDSLDH